MFIQRFLRALCFEKNYPSPGGLSKCLSQSSRLSAGGDAGESTGKCCTAHGLVPQLSAQFQYSAWLSPGCMHIKSGLWQLWKVITCSKGYIQDCCFHQFPRHTWFMARNILQQRTIIINNFSGTLLSNYFPNWLQWAATKSGGSSSSPPELHVYILSHSLPFFSPFYFSCMTHKLGSQPLPQIPKTEFQHHAALGSTAPPQGSAWTITSLLSYTTHEGHSTIFPFITSTQQCCGVLSQQLRGRHRKHSSSLPGFSASSCRSYRATPLHQLCCFVWDCVVQWDPPDWLSFCQRLSMEIKGFWRHGSLWVGGNKSCLSKPNISKFRVIYWQNDNKSRTSEKLLGLSAY